MVVNGFVGDTFETVDFGTLNLSETAVFGLFKVVARDVAEVAVAVFGRDVADTVDVAVFDKVVVSFDVAVVLVDGLDIVLENETVKFNTVVVDLTTINIKMSKYIVLVLDVFYICMYGINLSNQIHKKIIISNC